MCLSENGSKFAKGGKYLGKDIAGVGFGIGMYDDLANDDKTFGEALSHNGMTLAAGSTGTAVGAGLATFVLGSNATVRMGDFSRFGYEYSICIRNRFNLSK